MPHEYIADSNGRGGPGEKILFGILGAGLAVGAAPVAAGAAAATSLRLAVAFPRTTSLLTGTVSFARDLVDDNPGGGATTTVNGVRIKPLMGADGDAVVLGRQVDTAVAKGWAGHVVLDTPNWNLAVNDAFVRETIAQGRSVYLATPLEGNLVQTAGRYAG